MLSGIRQLVLNNLKVLLQLLLWLTAAIARRAHARLLKGLYGRHHRGCQSVAPTLVASVWSYLIVTASPRLDLLAICESVKLEISVPVLVWSN